MGVSSLMTTWTFKIKDEEKRRPQRRFMDVAKDMLRVDVTEDVQDGVRWRQMSHCGDP